MKKIILCLLILGTTSIQAFSKEKNALLRFYSNNIKDGEKMVFKIFPYGYSLEQVLAVTDTIVVHNKCAVIKIPFQSAEPYYITILPYSSGGPIYDRYLVNPSDNIILREMVKKNSDRISFDTCTFSGIGSQSFSVQWKIKRIQILSNHFLNSRYLDSIINSSKYTDTIYAQQVQFLKTYRNILTQSTYYSLMADLILGHQISYTFFLQRCMDLKDPNRDMNVINEHYTRVFAEQLRLGSENLNNQVPKSYIFNSQFFPSYTLTKYELDSALLLGEKVRENSCENYIIRNYRGLPREKLLTRLISRNLLTGDSNYIVNIVSLVKNAIPYIHSTDLRQYIISIENTRLPGSKVSDFSFADTSGIIRHLSEFKSKVIIIDTWHWGCGSCRLNQPILRKIEEKFHENKDVVFLSIVTWPYKWKEGISSGLYSDSLVVNLSANNAQKAPWFKSIKWDGTDPTLIMLDKTSKLMTSPILPIEDNGQDLTNKINQALEIKNF
jgi:thiol-disulfide isomerase/thioredoxin